MPCKEVQERAFRESILPRRYLRNFGTIGFEGQLRLLHAPVAIVGAGGLGGHIAELLARMGVGRLVLIDSDRFEDNNLNRQLGSTQNNLGYNKVDCLGKRISEINSGTTLSLHTQRLDFETSEALLGPCEVVADALDNVPSRFVLQKAVASLGIPMVHGAVGGFLGQVTTMFLKEIAERYKEAEKITLVLDNLNTHGPGSLYETFPHFQGLMASSKNGKQSHN